MKPTVGADRRPSNQAVMQELFTNNELLFREAHRSEEAGKVKRVGILGGGTAGWFTALALRAQLPWVDVTVLETPVIPIIGVGEASVPSLVAFLHRYLNLDVMELTREVRPTWKQGIRFEWGLPGDYAFQAPFDWEVNGIGMLGAMGETGNVSGFTLQGNLMARDVTPVLKNGRELQSFLHILAFAYHLDNARLVAYLTKVALARGVHHVDAKIVDAKVTREEGPDADPIVQHLVAEDGSSLSYDLYVDCSGFRSFLLGGAFEEPFTSFDKTLFTDSAIAFNTPNAGDPKPYTTARTMEHGWCWNIPMDEDDHLGYVFSSSSCSPDEALAEAKQKFPKLERERLVRFRSGRHRRLWVGNVFAIGNAYAFVEPLESTGLLMITRSIAELVRSFPIDDDQRATRRFVNASVGRDWDRLRWFLAAHYKFNRRSDSAFWTRVREEIDISGLEPALEMYRERGPLSLLPRAMRTSLQEEMGVFFYGLHGLDCILLGQKVPHKKIAREPSNVWRKRRASAMDFVRQAIPQAEALRATRAHPKWLPDLVAHPGGWVARMASFL